MSRIGGNATDPNALLPDALLDSVAGNVSLECKVIALKWFTLFRSVRGGFAKSISQRVVVVEVTIRPNPDYPRSLEGKVVSEIDVAEDMINADGTLDNGCAFRGSGVSLAVLKHFEGRPSSPGVSQTINAIFHNSAKLGARLRIVSTSMTVNREMMSCRCEIWDKEHHRLIASGVQQRIEPIKNPLTARL